VATESRIHIKKHIEGWQGIREGKAKPIFIAATKAQATKQGLAIALREKGELVVHKRNADEVQREFTFKS
jgi:hypothetical protein